MGCHLPGSQKGRRESAPYSICQAWYTGHDQLCSQKGGGHKMDDAGQTLGASEAFDQPRLSALLAESE